MDITFCDVCNESVPAGDLEARRAVQQAGRVICARCEAAMSGRPPASLEDTAFGGEVEGAQGDTALVAPVELPVRRAPAAPRGVFSTGIAVGIAAVALLAVGAAGAFLWERVGRQEQELARSAREDEAARAEARRGEERLAASIGEVAASLARSDEVLRGLGQRIDALSGSEGQARSALQGDVEGLAARTRALEDVRAVVESQTAGMAELAQGVSGLRRDLSDLTTRVASAERAKEAPKVEEKKAAPEPGWRAFVQDLKNPNSGVRWQAVQSLGASRDPAVLDVLLPMLKDSDIFVRMATARVLGDLGSTAAVGALIDVLEDAEASVREAADVALRAITGQDLEFDAGAKEAERAKRVKAWREWWHKFSEERGGA